MSYWIGVDQSLPIFERDVLVLTIDKHIRIAELWSDGTWHEQQEKIEVDDVTHWQSLPPTENRP